MPRLQIELDAATTEALTSLAGARGTTPADLAADIVERYVRVSDMSSAPPEPLDALVGSIDAFPNDDYRAPPDPFDELVGRYRGDRVNDIDEIVYGR